MRRAPFADIHRDFAVERTALYVARGEHHVGIYGGGFGTSNNRHLFTSSSALNGMRLDKSWHNGHLASYFNM
jgi:hypothetical protein